MINLTQTADFGFNYGQFASSLKLKRKEADENWLKTVKLQSWIRTFKIRFSKFKNLRKK